MIIQVFPGRVSGALTANASKSAMQRACAAALVREGASTISRAGNSNDDIAAISIIENLGAEVHWEDERTLVVKGRGNKIAPKTGEVHCGESGLSIRMFTPIAALANEPVRLTGHGSLTVRPMNFFEEVLPALGVSVNSSQGLLPLEVHGPLQPRDLTVDGSLSSQFLTGLLMAFGALRPDGQTITVTDLKSKPYIDLTLEVMRDFELAVPKNNNYEQFIFSAQPVSDSEMIHYAVEGDWSGAAFLLVAAAISGEVTVTGLRSDSRQADKRIIDALLDAGASVEVKPDTVWVKKNELHAFEFDATHCPDLFPPLVALAASCEGITVIKGLTRLKHKESDRGLTLQEEFGKLGITILLREDEMHIYGNTDMRVVNTTCNAHHDHRIAMAIAVAALRADFPVSIRHADAVNKSYPDFWQHIRELGVVAKEVTDKALL